MESVDTGLRASLGSWDGPLGALQGSRTHAAGPFGLCRIFRGSGHMHTPRGPRLAGPSGESWLLAFPLPVDQHRLQREGSDPLPHRS